MEIHKKLIEIQQELKAPKNQYNSFGKYKYRSLEDILEAVKPLLKKHKLTLKLSDSVIETGSFTYINAIAILSDEKNTVEVAAQAGIEKAGGMQLAQAFGSASSYARKYALNGLFLIDDTKDADATNKHDKGAQQPKTSPNGQAPKPKQTPSKEWVMPTPKTTPENLAAAGWDLKTIHTTDDNRHYVETSKSYVLLSPKQFETLSNKVA